MALPTNKITKIKLSNDAEYEIIPKTLRDGSTNYKVSVPTLNQDSTLLLGLVSVTYSELAAKIANNDLLPGQFYRITDYNTILGSGSLSNDFARSAGHQFDLIVQAISNNELSEDASACLHEGDTYFANSNLKAWVIKYCFENNNSRYKWADTTNGKGVIYYMRDDFYNEAPYDFKNIQYKRYKITACANCPSLVGKYYGIQDILTSYMTIDTNDYKWFYTFDCCGIDYSLNPVGTTCTASDGATFTLNQIQCSKCSLVPEAGGQNKFILNDFVVIIEANMDCMFTVTGTCGDVTFVGGSTCVQFGSCFNAIVGAGGTRANGYVGYGTKITDLHDCLLYTSGASKYVFYEAIIGTLRSCCLTSSGNYVVSASIIERIITSVLSAGSSVIMQSTLGSIQSCTISSSGYVFYRSNISLIISCTGSGNTNFCSCCSGTYLHTVTMGDTTINDSFMYHTNFASIWSLTATKIWNSIISSLSFSTFKVINGCKFGRNGYITCNQDLRGCEFGADVSYLTLSSTDTTQTITNTNIHDITGTDADHIKTVVIPEDYTNVHTVEVYSSAQYSVHEID